MAGVVPSGGKKVVMLTPFFRVIIGIEGENRYLFALYGYGQINRFFEFLHGGGTKSTTGIIEEKKGVGRAYFVQTALASVPKGILKVVGRGAYTVLRYEVQLIPECLSTSISRMMT
jgi:hypothetical protein